MLNFIVLGYVPGTSIQISFFNYLLTMSAVTLGAGCYWHFLGSSVRKKARHIAAIQLIAL